MWKKATQTEELQEGANQELNHDNNFQIFAKANISMIGKGMCFKGDFSGQDSLIVQGKLEGTVKLKEEGIKIDNSGELVGNIVAKIVLIKGKLLGDAHALEQIVVCKGANVQGNLISARIIVEDGALIKGVIDMDENTVKDYVSLNNNTMDSLAKSFQKSTVGIINDDQIFNSPLDGNNFIKTPDDKVKLRKEKVVE